MEEGIDDVGDVLLAVSEAIGHVVDQICFVHECYPSGGFK